LQLLRQVPAEQSCVAPHTVVQDPQCDGSSWVLTQAPLHEVVPPVQVHTPALHAVPAGHALPHEPQFALLLETLTQVRLQFVLPVGQYA